jgi:drug/metabolite transporter (DMT)-like permease
MKRAYVLMHLAIFLWGFTGLFGKAIDLSEALIVWYRLALSAGALAVYMAWKGRSLRMGGREALQASGVGCIVCIHWLTFYASIKASNVSVALACFSSIALFTSVLEPFFFRVRHRLSELLLGLGVIAGLYTVFSFQQAYLAGILLAVLSALLASVFTILNKKLVVSGDPARVTLYELTAGFLFLTLLLPLYFEVTGTAFAWPSAADWLYLLLLSVLCTTVAFTISMEALREVNAFTMNLSVNLEPVYSILLAMLFFQEQKFLNAGFFAGAAVIIGSVVAHSLLTVRRTRRVL